METTVTTAAGYAFERVIDGICDLDWASLGQNELKAVAAAYYFFSKQFCETVDIACALYPTDEQLIELRAGECDTDNLSPYPGVAEPGERMSHDEFMRRVVKMAGLPVAEAERVQKLGADYLARARVETATTRTLSLASYEDGGLERVFRAVLRAQDWNEPSLAAFRHFLVGHINLDSDPDAGHGALCRHLVPNDTILPLWQAFRDLLVGAAPRLAQ
jgi:hypothetical protein